MIVHLVDGTYELFRHFYGLRRGRPRVPAGSAPATGGAPVTGAASHTTTEGAAHATTSAAGGSTVAATRDDPPLDAVRGVLRTVLAIIERGATHVGVATDHVIESFRNDLWPGYKTGDGVDPALLAQFRPLEDALTAMGVPVWAMVELEADDALASAARLAAADPRVEQVRIWTVDKDLAQCVRDGRVVQVDSRDGSVRDAAGVRQKFGVPPDLIPDYLALVGDSADGFPGVKGIGPKTAARLLERYGPLERLPEDVLKDGRDLARLFKHLATLRTDAPLFTEVDELEWLGPREGFAAWADRLRDPALLERCERALKDRQDPESSGMRKSGPSGEH